MIILSLRAVLGAGQVYIIIIVATDTQQVHIAIGRVECSNG